MTFFTAVNPCMRMGGFIDYSKYKILKRLPGDIIPTSILLRSPVTPEGVLELLKENKLTFPVILKPNRGQRGFAVAKIEDYAELDDYLKKYHTELVLQEYIDANLEFGIMYHRHPSEETGKITSVVRKVFLEVEGDGKSSLRQLISSSPRGKYYKKLLFRTFEAELDQVLKTGEKKRLVEIGNHCKGATFYNDNHLINGKLVEVFDKISKEVDGFYFGRYDIKCDTLDDLYRGRIKVVELNGVNSEPAHIYDPKMPLRKAYGVMFRHWKIIFKIGTYNRKMGIRYMPLREAYSITRKHFKRRKTEIN